MNRIMKYAAAALAAATAVSTLGGCEQLEKRHQRIQLLFHLAIQISCWMRLLI